MLFLLLMLSVCLFVQSSSTASLGVLFHRAATHCPLHHSAAPLLVPPTALHTTASPLQHSLCLSHPYSTAPLCPSH